MRQLLVAAILLSSPVTLLAQNRPAAPPDGDVELRVLGPDAKPAPNINVQIVAASKIDFTEILPEATTKTDNQGVARFRWPGGNYQMKVYVKNLGYGKTGIVEVSADHAAVASLPPLIPYAHVFGILPASLRADDAIVAIHSRSRSEPGVSTRPDGQGSFQLNDLPAGWSSLSLTRAGNETIIASLYLVAGDTVENPPLRLPAEPKPTPSLAPPATANAVTPAAPATKPAAWLAGITVDENQKPIPNATVYVMTTFDGGIRMVASSMSTTSDAQGRFSFNPQQTAEDAATTILAVAPSHAPAWSWRTPNNNPVTLVLSSKSASLALTLINPADGSPLKNAGATLWRQDSNLRDEWARDGGDASDQMNHAAYPHATTDAAGVARFENLVPGRYRIVASDPDDKQIRRTVEWSPFNKSPTLLGLADDVPIALGPNTFKLPVYPQTYSSKIRVLRADATPLSGNVPLEYRSFSRGGWSTSHAFPDTGITDFAFASYGLSQVQFQYRNTPIASYPIHPPFFASTGIFASSPSLPSQFTTTLTAHRIDLPKLRATVLDADFKPLRCVVEITTPYGESLLQGSTNDNGQISFESIPASTGEILVSIAGKSSVHRDPLPFDRYDFDSPLPTSDQLPKTAYLPQKVSATPNSAPNLTFKPQPVGWVRGKVQLATDSENAYTSINFGLDPYIVTASSRYHRPTHEFLLGPLPPGPAQISARQNSSLGEDTLSRTVNVEAGKTVTLDLIAPAKSARDPRHDAIVGLGNLAAHDLLVASLNGQILLPDGKTPAFGAHALLICPPLHNPDALGITDALGQIHPRSRERYMPQDTSSPPGSPTEPLIVAFLPGSHGATILPLPKPGEPLRITLPPSIRISGTVTVAGIAPTKRPGHIRILAAYQGKGLLAPILSVQTTADLDGHFDLAGLTPGTYKIQAALDDIWLSETATLSFGVAQLIPATNDWTPAPTPSITTAAAEAPKPLTLNIPAPGAPAIIKVLDASKKPVIGLPLTLSRPSGPLTDMLSPAIWTTDGAGTITVPTLEAGPHQIQFPDSPAKTTFTIPALPADKPIEVELTH